ncbi:hypothetical protein RF11_10603 [Thelohanellus kitauei]|uniref:Uncharacterized protein n=1 Tax=Thelohanellus kitauei TaxID=669202 RepID=A0A0C2JMT6_THEKT|nr:hypothetical protein RF11_10603 [Thelohanellus kitauei]
MAARSIDYAKVFEDWIYTFQKSSLPLCLIYQEVFSTKANYIQHYLNKFRDDIKYNDVLYSQGLEKKFLVKPNLSNIFASAYRVSHSKSTTMTIFISHLNIHSLF